MIIEYNSFYYRQKTRAPMGGNNSTKLANIFSFMLERLVLKNFNSSEILMYTRYIDDLFLVCDCKETAQRLVDQFNVLDSNITYNMCVDSQEVNFHDLTIYVSRSSDGGWDFFANQILLWTHQ